MSSLTILWFPYLEGKSRLADLDRLLLSDSETNMWNQKQIAWVELRALMIGDITSVNGYTGVVNLNIDDIDGIPTPAGSWVVLTWNGTNYVWVPAAGASGETNLMSNVGTGDAIGVYSTKSSVTFQMRWILGKEGIESSLSGNNIELGFKVSTLTNTQKTDLAAALDSYIGNNTTLEGLTDTNLTALTANQVLTWDGTQWINQAVGALGFNINTLSTVTTGNAVNDYIPMYSASLATQKKITVANLWVLMGISADASISVKGLTKLSVAPVTTNNPIAVWDNDPRMSLFWYDAIVSSIGGTHTQLSAAINAGKQNILIRSGIYTDVPPAAVTIGQNVRIQCEGSVIMNINAVGTSAVFSVNWCNFSINWGTWNVTSNQPMFYFVYTTSTRSSIMLEGCVVQNILNSNNSQVYLVYGNTPGWNDTAHIEWVYVYNTLWSASIWCSFFPANLSWWAGCSFVACVFRHQISGGGINALSELSSFFWCTFYADWSWAVRNYLYIANAKDCTGWWSDRLYILNVMNCTLNWINQKADVTYNVGTSQFRINANGECIWNTISSSYTTGNILKLGNASIFTGNTVTGGAHITMGEAGAWLAARMVVSNNLFALWASGVPVTATIKQRISIVTANVFYSNFGAAGTGTAMVTTIESAASYSQVSNNIFTGQAGSAPSISDLSTGSIKTDNIFTNSVS